MYYGVFIEELIFIRPHATPMMIDPSDVVFFLWLSLFIANTIATVSAASGYIAG